MSKKIDYAAQYKHPKWQAKRLEILEREKFTCQDCGSKDKTLHVHHGYYQNDLSVWEYEDKALWCLCEDCHLEWGKLTKMLHAGIGCCHMKDYQHMFDFIRGLYSLQLRKKENNE